LFWPILGPAHSRITACEQCAVSHTVRVTGGDIRVALTSGGRAFMATLRFHFALAALGMSTAAAFAANLLPGFQESVAFGGLNTPTAVRFAADGRVFIAEKSG